MAQSYYDVEALKRYIATNAPKYGLDPATALKVWTGEGLRDGVWQSNVYKNGKRENSFGPFQFYMDGGMGNVFQKATGLDPRDPKNVYAMADWAMAHAGKKGWGEWYAARDQGIGPWQGIARTYDGPMPTSFAGGDDPSIVAQNVGGFQFPHAPNFDAMPGLVNVVSAAGAPPSTAPAAPQTGIMGAISRIFSGTGKAPDPYYLSKFDEASKRAYMAQNLQDKGWPSLRSFLG